MSLKGRRTTIFLPRAKPYHALAHAVQETWVFSITSRSKLENLSLFFSQLSFCFSAHERVSRVSIQMDGAKDVARRLLCVLVRRISCAAIYSALSQSSLVSNLKWFPFPAWRNAGPRFAIMPADRVLLELKPRLNRAARLFEKLTQGQCPPTGQMTLEHRLNRNDRKAPFDPSPGG